jgi:hypothetical protein
MQSIGLVLSVILFFAAVYLIVRAFKLLELKSDPPLLLSLISITIALALQTCYQVFAILYILQQGYLAYFDH